MDSATPETKLLPVGPMARRVRVPARWLKDEAEAGRIPALKAGARLLFNPDAVERSLLERAAEPVEHREVRA